MTTVTNETLNAAVEFDVPFTLTPGPNGTAQLTDPTCPRCDGPWGEDITCPTCTTEDGHPRPLRAPDVALHPTDDVTVSDSAWTPLTGHTGQYGYDGAVLHPSEVLGGGLADRILTDGGTYVVVEVRDEEWDYPDGDPIGWSVLRLDPTD